MPPASPTKSSIAKKVQVSTLQNRPKGAGRAKSGCYTCRLRRKKCDELRVGDETGPCATCARLKLECLGFGAKRPDWMRDTAVIAEIRERIKEYLGSQGMIKGHSGAGPRVQVQEDYLRLSDIRDGPSAMGDYPSGSSSSDSPGREDSVESENNFPLPQYQQYQQPLMRLEELYTGQSDLVSTRCDSPMDPSLQFEYPSQYPFPMVTPSGYDLTPARRSQLSTLYHAHFTIDDPEPEYEYDPMNPSPSIIFPSNILPDYLIHDSMREYVNNVVKIQYLLGDKLVLPEMIWEAVSRHLPSKEAVSLLSQAYYSRQVNRNSFMLQDETVQLRVSKLKDMLSAAEARFNSDDAMAALHIVSLYLFDGGQGRWDEFLSFACSYTTRVLDDPRYRGSYPDALEGTSEKEKFVIKTTIWFDVIASITIMKPPRLLKYIRQLFQPTWIPRGYSMLTPMGCENSVVWALAETSNLAYWKAKSIAQGNLSIRQLVNQVQEIEPYLLPPPRPIEPRDSPEGWSRFLTSEIFRTSTRLFLKSVESGDHPHVPEIRSCVQDTLNAIIDRPPNEDGLDYLASSTSAVIRSTVFGFYICGSLTDSEPVLNVLQSRLTQKPGDEGVGNTTTISDLLTILWDERRLQMAGHPVRWRKLLRKREILLV